MSIHHDTLMSGAVVLITGGTHVGHTAIILGSTAKMYHVRLDNAVVTKVKKTNIQTLEAPIQPNLRSTPDSMPASARPVNLAEATSAESDSNPSARRLTRRNLARQAERLECERKITEAVEEIHRQSTIVAELARQIKILDLADDNRP